MSLLRGVYLFLGLEGTVLIASAYKPIGLKPPSGNFFQRVRWIFNQQDGISVSFNQPMFYGGLLCLFLAYFIAAFMT